MPANDIAWSVDDSVDVTRYHDPRGSVALTAPGVARVIPDGCRVLVSAWIAEEEVYVDRVRQNVPVRTVSVSLVDESGGRDKAGGSCTFAGTQASGSCYARFTESTRYDRDPAGEQYWRMRESTSWRLDGFADDLPDGARRAMADTFESACAWVDAHASHLFAGGTLVNLERRLGYAESDLDKARTEVKAQRALVRRAARRHARALESAGAGVPG